MFIQILLIVLGWLIATKLLLISWSFLMSVDEQTSRFMLGIRLIVFSCSLILYITGNLYFIVKVFKLIFKT